MNIIISTYLSKGGSAVDLATVGKHSVQNIFRVQSITARRYV